MNEKEAVDMVVGSLDRESVPSEWAYEVARMALELGIRRAYKMGLVLVEGGYYRDLLKRGIPHDPTHSIWD